MTKRVSFLAAALLVAMRPPGTRAEEKTKPEPSRIEIPSAARRDRHPITLDEIVSRRVPQDPRLSPDGKRAAFLVRQGFRDSNSYRTALFVVGTETGSRPVKLLEEAAISSIGWTPDGRFVTYLSAKSGSVQLWRIAAGGGKPESVFSHAPGPEETVTRRGYNPSDKTEVGVLAYEFSPDGGKIAFSAPGRPDPKKSKAQELKGVLYDDESMNMQTLLNKSWSREPTGLWVYDISSKAERKFWDTPDEISGFAWSPDGRRIAVSYAAPPLQRESMIFFNQDLGILSLDDGRFAPVAQEEAVETHPAWSPDGRSLAFLSVLDENTSIVILDPGTGARKELAKGSLGSWVPGLWWDRDPSHLLVELPSQGLQRRGTSALYRVSLAGGAPQKISSAPERLSDCSIPRGRGEAVCIRQSSNIPPDPARVSLTDGSVRTLAQINPEFEAVALAPVAEMRWKNKYGDETNGYLIRPETKAPAPLLLILYGFGGEFVTDAEWISSYPAQAFARDGFAVLMMNYPRYKNWKGRDYSHGSVAEGFSPLASMETAVKTLVDGGVVDPGRVGILGWSYGCFLTEFAITHSDLFHAASAGDGGDYNPGAYWILGRRALRENYERVMGGPPYGETLKNWQEFSPAFNAHKAHVPVLMEFNPQEGLIGLEMSAALRRHGVPVEFVLYPDEGHIFTQPEHRYFSMQRNLDWFRFWLQGKERPDPDAREQYARWRQMRKAVGERERKS